MLRNYLAAGLRNLVRNRLYAAINIAGLAVGLAAALLITLFVRDEVSYDRWIPGHDRTYLMTEIRSDIGNFGPVRVDGIFGDLAHLLKLAFPSIETVSRLENRRVSIRHGNVDANEEIYWADPEIFDVLPLPSFAGDLRTALYRPDGVVITRSIARKYFGRDDPLGETLEINRQHLMVVTAVLEDLPSNTHLADIGVSIIASGRAAFSAFEALTPGFRSSSAQYVRLVAGTDVAEFERELPAFMERQTDAGITGPPEHRAVLVPVPIAKLHLSPPPFNRRPDTQGGSGAVILTVALVGLLILLVASINFVNITTAWATRRATEVGVRKVSGAERRQLIVQFLGEALLYVFFGTAIAVGLVALLAPTLQAFLHRTTLAHSWRDPTFLLGIGGFAMLLGLLAGAYPAFILSAFRPASVLKSSVVQGTGSVWLRRLLAALQFAILIGLIVATATIHSQLHFALNDGMRLNMDQVLRIDFSCKGAFKDEVRALPGVKAIACSNSAAAERATFIGTPIVLPGGTQISGTKTAVGPGFFELYGIRPVAGRLFSDDRGDELPYITDPTQRRHPSVIILNETGVRKFGFGSPTEAIGKTLGIPAFGEALDRSLTKAEIVGVVPDFSLNSIGSAVQPTFFYADPVNYNSLNVKLTGKDIPETLAAIDRLWKEFGDPRPITRSFVDQRVEDLFNTITRQGQLFAIFAAIAIFIACLGLFGLAAFTAERRTKEIGVRKAMGASRGDILKLILWEFAKPVLWANVIAWPVGYAAMHRWLEGFAYHVPLSPWTFLAASALALLIAVATVAGHALMVARSRPASALRYE